MQKSIHTARYAVLLGLLVRARREAKLTQAELAARLSMTQSAVSKVERGERRLDVVELHDWCRALGRPFPAFAAALDRQLQDPRVRRGPGEKPFVGGGAAVLRLASDVPARST